MTAMSKVIRSLQVEPTNEQRRLWLLLRCLEPMHQPQKPITYHHQRNGTNVSFLRFTQTGTYKLVGDQGIDSPWTLASLSDDDTTTICDMIRRPGLVSSDTADRGSQISVLVAKNLKVTVFMFKMMEHFSRAYSIQLVDST